MHESSGKPRVWLDVEDGVLVKETHYPNGRITRTEETDEVFRVLRGYVAPCGEVVWETDITVDSPAPQSQPRPALLMAGPARAGFGPSSIDVDVEAA